MVKELFEVSGYLPPSTELLSNSLLDDVYADIERADVEVKAQNFLGSEKFLARNPSLGICLFKCTFVFPMYVMYTRGVFFCMHSKK